MRHLFSTTHPFVDFTHCSDCSLPLRYQSVQCQFGPFHHQLNGSLAQHLRDDLPNLEPRPTHPSTHTRNQTTWLCRSDGTGGTNRRCRRFFTGIFTTQAICAMAWTVRSRSLQCPASQSTSSPWPATKQDASLLYIIGVYAHRNIYCDSDY